ncbi:hypothetical protein C8R46DRAFT_1099019 [Mycena filopes]|nr:hypothetical protein C8R46DRAFT_1099019 [Mycena filopes]
MSQRVVAVFGATGLQGSSVVDALLKDGTFTPRAISRNPNSAASQKLKARGVQVVRGSSLDKVSLASAMEGCEAVFAVTVLSYGHVEGQDELAQGRNMVDAAKDVGVKFFIWAYVPQHSGRSNGKYQNCTHYDDKAAVQEYLKTSGLPHASLLLPAFLENFWSYDILKKTDKGYTFALPLAPHAKLQCSWIGRDVPAAAALALLNSYTDASKGVDSKAHPVVNGKITYAELAAKMSAVPQSELVALGMKFSTVDEFVEVEVKARYGQ